MGAMNTSIVVASGVGVTIAATMVMTKMAYRRFFQSHCGVTMPKIESTKINTGSSKIAPSPTITMRIKSKYSLMLMSGWNGPCGPWKVMRNFRTNGNKMKYAKPMPQRKRKTDERMKESTALRSCL